MLKKKIKAYFLDEYIYSRSDIRRADQTVKEGKIRNTLTEDLHFVIDGKKYTIKSGYKSDGGSIPRFAWRTIGCPFGAVYEPAAWVHDILCESKIVDYKEAGEIMLALMEWLNVARWRRNIIFLAIKTCWIYQKKYTNVEIDFAKNHLEVNND